MFRLFISAVLLLVLPLLPEQNPSANDLVRRVVANELQMQNNDHSHWMYQLESRKSGGSETKEVVGTNDGALSRLIARNGQPLTAEQQSDEDARLKKFVGDPERQLRQKRAAEEDARKTKAIFAMLPDAFLFHYTQESGSTGDVVQLSFEPNPKFQPPSREARVLHEMTGQLTVDRKLDRLVEIKGQLMQQVNFGGGILGHLDRGGTFEVHQEQVAPSHWEITRLRVSMNGKALFFKTISVQQDESRSHFRPVSDSLTLSQAADLLLKQNPR